MASLVTDEYEVVVGEVRKIIFVKETDGGPAGVVWKNQPITEIRDEGARRCALGWHSRRSPAAGYNVVTDPPEPLNCFVILASDNSSVTGVASFLVGQRVQPFIRGQATFCESAAALAHCARSADRSCTAQRCCPCFVRVTTSACTPVWSTTRPFWSYRQSLPFW